MTEQVVPEGTQPAAGVTPEPNQELDQILNALDQAPEQPAKPAEPAATPPVVVEKPKEGEPAAFYKKVGTLEFKSEAEYDAYVSKTHGDKIRVEGELEKIKREGLPPQPKPGEAPAKATDVDVNKLRWQIKVEDFLEANPAAEEYRIVMASILKAGKANDEQGRPSLQLAFEKALRADGKDVPTTTQPVEKEDNKINQRRIMRSGGGENGDGSGSVYQDKSELDEASDFADRAITGQIQ